MKFPSGPFTLWVVALVRKRHPRVTKKRQYRRWPVPLAKAASQIPCSLAHLHGVLTGARVSRRVKERYEELAKLKGGAR